MRSFHTYEIATAFRGVDPAMLRTLQRLKAWNTAPERCARCKRTQAAILQGDTALCRGCSAADRPADPRLQARLARQAAIQTQIAEEQRSRAVCGLALPYDCIEQIGEARFETWRRGALQLPSGKVDLLEHHDGPVVGTARVFSLFDGVYFEGAFTHARSAFPKQCSIEFRDGQYELVPAPHRDGLLRLMTHAKLTKIALVRTPAFKTWASAATPEAWRRVYAGSQRTLHEMAS